MKNFALVIIALMMAVWTTAPLSAAPQTFIVNDAAQDGGDITPGNGVCDSLAGTCTLRAAIMEANATTDHDTIVLDVGVYAMQTAGISENNSATGDYDILNPVTIQGAGTGFTTINANNLDRVFHIFSADVIIEGMTIRSGNSDEGGAGILMEDNSELTLNDVWVNQNSTTAGGGGVWLVQNATLNLESVIFDDNLANVDGAHLLNMGTVNIFSASFGDIFGNTSLVFNAGGTISGSSADFSDTEQPVIVNDFGTINLGVPTFSNNTETLIASNGGSVSLSEAWIADNVSASTLFRMDNGANLSIIGTDISNNSTNDRLIWMNDGGTLTLNGTRFEDNVADEVLYLYSSGAVTITNSQFDTNEGLVIDTFQTDITMTNAPIAHTLNGRGMDVEESTVSITDSSLVDNDDIVINNINGTVHLDGGFTVQNSGEYVFNNGGVMTITHAVIAANDPQQDVIQHTGTSLTVTHSTIISNLSEFGTIIDSQQALTVENSTFFNNASPNYSGTINIQDGEANLTQVTIVGNGDLEGNITPNGGAIYQSGGLLTVTNSVLYWNTAAVLGSDCDLQGGTFITNGVNLFTALGGCTADAQDMIYDIEPEAIFQELHWTEGETSGFFAPWFTSPLTDAADPAFCTVNDQIGLARPVGEGCDIGAIEYDNSFRFGLLAPGADTAPGNTLETVTDFVWMPLAGQAITTTLVNVSLTAPDGTISTWENLNLDGDVSCTDTDCTYTIPNPDEVFVWNGLYTWNVTVINPHGSQLLSEAPFYFTIDNPNLATDLVINGSFEIDDNTDKVPDNWNAKNSLKDKRKCDKPEQDKYVAYAGQCAYQFKGVPGDTQRAKLQQKIDGDAGLIVNDTLTLSVAVNNRSGAANAKVAQVKVIYTEPDPDKPGKTLKAKFFVVLPAAGTDYEVVTTQQIIEYPVASVKFDLRYKAESGKVYVDAYQLLKNAPEMSLKSTNGLIPVPESFNSLQSSRD